MLDFCSKHNIACDVEVIPTQEVNEAYGRVLRSDVRYICYIYWQSVKMKYGQMEILSLQHGNGEGVNREMDRMGTSKKHKDIAQLVWLRT